MSVSHPDIHKFIHYKATLSPRNQAIVDEAVRNGLKISEKQIALLRQTLIEGQLNHFNISVEIPDTFMQAVLEGRDWGLVSPSTGETVKTVKASDLLMELAKKIWASGDPGVFFSDAVNADNMVKYISEVVGCNPCFSYDTKLLTTEGYKCIGDLDGKSVDIYDKNGDVVKAGVFKTGDKETVRIRLTNKQYIDCTPDHVFMTTDQREVKASDLKGEKLMPYLYSEEHSQEDITSKLKNAPTVVSVEANGVEPVYDFNMERTHWGVVEGFVAHNCAEVNLLSYEPCDLGSINLHSFYNPITGLFDYDLLIETVKNSIIFLDGVHDVSENRVQRVNEMAKGLRRVGLGVMGWADLLAELEIPYSSEAALNFAKHLSAIITFTAWNTSLELAKVHGPFSMYDKDKVDLSVIQKVLDSEIIPDDVAEKFMEEVREYGLRNVSVTALAPTGTIAMLADVNSCIEPFFALAYKRNVTLGEHNLAKETILEVNPVLERKLDKFGYSKEQQEEILTYVAEHGTLIGSTSSPELDRIFETSHFLDRDAHIRMQAAWQSSVSNAISKTINLPNHATPEDIYDGLIQTWFEGLKSCTFYRDGSKKFQILNVGSNTDESDDTVQPED